MDAGDRKRSPTMKTTTHCPLCSAIHTVTSLDRIDERGRPVSAADAMMTAHYREEMAARLAQPFQLFGRNTKPARKPALRLVRTPAEAAPVAAPVAPAACPEGYFVADWDAAKKARRAEMAKAAKARRAAAKKAAVA